MIFDNPFRVADPRTWPVGFWLWIGIIAAGFVPGLWKRFQRQRATSWPLADGRIESVNVTRPNKWFRTSQKATPDVAEIGYSYSVGGSAHGGVYEREFASSDAAWDFVRDLQGKPVTIHYNPNRHSSSALSEPSLDTLIQARPPLTEGKSARPKAAVPRWVKPLLWIGVIYSAVGFVVSLSVNIAALRGQRVLSDPLFFAMHAGIFVVWFPAVIVVREMMQDVQRKQDIWKAALKDAPDWMRYLVYCVFAYDAFLGLTIFIGHSQNRQGSFSAIDWLGFSAMWMVFYSAAMAVLYSAANYGKSPYSDCGMM